MLKLTEYLQSGYRTTDATATAADIAEGKTAYVAAGKVTGSLVPGTAFYKCASVDVGAKTWTGYKATIGERYITFAATATTGLTYSGFAPNVGSVYSEDGLLEISHFTDAASLSALDQLDNIAAVVAMNRQAGLTYSGVTILGVEEHKIYAYDINLATAALGSDGYIYPPQIISSEFKFLRRINTSTGAVEYTSNDIYTWITSSSATRLISAVACGDRIYFARWTSEGWSKIDVFDTQLGTYASIGSGSLESAGARGFLGPDGKVYFIYASGKFYRVDPSDNSRTELSTLPSSYTYAVPASDGYVYLFKNSGSANILRFDPTTGIASSLDIGTFPGDYYPAMWLDGCIYAARMNVLWKFDPATDTITSTSLTGANTSNGHTGMILAPDGYLYTAGYGARPSGRIDPANATLTYLSDAVYQAAWCIAPNGDMYAFAGGSGYANRRYDHPTGLTNFSAATLTGPWMQK